MANIKIRHITRYTYTAPVLDSANQILLYPLDDAHQQVVLHELRISHNPVVETFTDFFGNTAGVFTILKPHTELVIQSSIQVKTEPVILPVDLKPAKEQWEMLRVIDDQFPYGDFLTQEKFHSRPEVHDEVAGLMNTELTPLSLATNMAAFVYNNFEYKQGITSVETGIDEVWALKAGVCQDFAHILLVMLRMIGIPSRYVSGYICPAEQEFRGAGATHAWVDAYIPDYGWIGLDPTNNCIPSDRHVRLAIGRNFSDCTPVKGTYKGQSDHSLEVSVIIENDNPAPEPEELTINPTYSYKVHVPAIEMNSYQKFVEMQMQQQQ
jgi:transglutaminase-like putative cysteine protease